MSKTLTEESKRGWYSSSGPPSNEQLKLGCLQRIASATEAMAKRHAELISNAERYERWYLKERDRAEKLERSNAALRGVITRMKREAQQKGGA